MARSGSFPSEDQRVLHAEFPGPTSAVKEAVQGMSAWVVVCSTLSYCVFLVVCAVQCVKYKVLGHLFFLV